MYNNSMMNYMYSTMYNNIRYEEERLASDA